MIINSNIRMAILATSGPSCHSRKPSKEKALNFTVGIKNTPPNYSFMPKNCFELPLWTKLLSDTSPNKIYLASIDSHY